MNTLSIKLPAELYAALQLASQRQRVSKSEFVPRAVVAYLDPANPQGQPASALSLAGDQPLKHGWLWPVAPTAALAVTAPSMYARQGAFSSDIIMTTLRIRGLDGQALAELKKRAALEDASVNALVLKLIDQGLGLQPSRPALRRHDDLDALAGAWSAAEAEAFEAATSALEQVDAGLWA